MMKNDKYNITKFCASELSAVLLYAPEVKRMVSNGGYESALAQLKLKLNQWLSMHNLSDFDIHSITLIGDSRKSDLRLEDMISISFTAPGYHEKMKPGIIKEQGVAPIDLMVEVSIYRSEVDALK
jgi:hypothetical protein